jgi:hypothetical protein
MINSIESAFADRWKEYSVEATCDDLVILFFKAYDPYHTLPRRIRIYPELLKDPDVAELGNPNNSDVISDWDKVCKDNFIENKRRIEEWDFKKEADFNDPIKYLGYEVCNKKEKNVKELIQTTNAIIVKFIKEFDVAVMDVINADSDHTNLGDVNSSAFKLWTNLRHINYSIVKTLENVIGFSVQSVQEKKQFEIKILQANNGGCVSICIYICVCKYKNMYVYIHIHVYVHMYIYIHVYMFVMYIFISNVSTTICFI